VFVVAIMGLGKTSIKLRGAEVGIEAVMLGVVTSIGGM
jgi:SP family sugar:H+ symporter-like MFS transporter